MDGTVQQIAGGSTIRFERHLPYTVEAVWDSLTEPQKLVDWLAAAEVELTEGGRFQLTFANTGDVMNGKVIQVQSPSVLAYTWNSEDPNESVVQWELTPEADGCLLLLKHTIRVPERLSYMLAGWHVHLDLLAETLAGEVKGWPWSHWESMREKYAKQLGE
ncbi:SRPBCC family protein [Brevibacillus reuszeri]|uniref:SRPBCC family protein n=1 Tax=Brevibacillus reuszeri TaxID=54915 RepID=UPI00289DA54F|nr:SRPBCC family protein [Brevibacillus reuszeri]